MSFWKEKTLEQMTEAEWESLCDGCGRCCLNKIEDPSNNKVYYTSIACHLLDCNTCRCTDYENRQQRIADCVKISLDNKEAFDWMPETCAYRILYNGGELPEWHPLVTGDPESVHKAGISVRHKTIHPDDLPDDFEYFDYIID